VHYGKKKAEYKLLWIISKTSKHTKECSETDAGRMADIYVALTSEQNTGNNLKLPGTFYLGNYMPDRLCRVQTHDIKIICTSTDLI